MEYCASFDWEKVICTKSGGPMETVVDGVTGIWCAESTGECFGRALQTILHTMSREQRAAMGRAGKERVEQYFSEPRLLSEWQHLLERTVTRGQQRRLQHKERKSWAPKTRLYLFEAVMSLLLYWFISQVQHLIWYLILWFTTTTTSSSYSGAGRGGDL